jgi:hypothetical protein
LVKKNLNKKFGDILIGSIDEALLTLGENAKASIYLHLETKFAITKQDIPRRVDDFSDALDQIFGLAARQLEILIMQCLSQKVKCAYKWDGPSWLVPDLTFEKYVALMELSYNDDETSENVEILVDGDKQRKEIRK